MGRPVTEATATRRRWPRALSGTFGAFIFFFAIMAIWSFGTPIWGVPDEPAHVLRAYSAAHGQFYVSPNGATGGTGGVVTVPRSLAESGNSTSCYAFNPQVSAACAHDPVSGSHLVAAPSSAARYNPAYYLVVGLPSLIMGEHHLLYAMRLVSAALSAWMLAWALTSAALVRRPRIGMVAVLVAATPMVYFLGGGVNPNGLEITAACALWVNLLLLFRSDDKARRPLLIRRAAIAASIMVTLRSLSPVWLVLIIALACLAATPGLRQRLRRRDSTRWAIVVLVFAVLSVIWIEVSQSLTQLQLAQPLHLGLGDRLSLARRRQLFDFDSEVGLFGWLDTRLPQWAYNAWGITGLAASALAFVFIRWRDRIAVAAIAAVGYGVPIAIEAQDWNKAGGVWQGRYSLPLTVGLVILIGLALAESGWLPDWIGWIVAVSIAAGTATFMVWCFLITLRRNAVGVLAPFDIEGLWRPVGGAVRLSAALAFVTLIGTVAVLVMGARLAPIARNGRVHHDAGAIA